MDLRNFFGELKRRNVYKVALAYGVVGSASEFSLGRIPLGTTITFLDMIRPGYLLRLEGLPFY